MTNFKFPEHNDFNLKNSTLVVTLSGSRAYGTNTPESDWDYKGIVLPPKEILLNPFKNFEHKEWKEGEAEGTFYSLDRFCQLAAGKQNPNLLEILFSPPENIIYSSPEFKMIQEIAQDFLSVNIGYSFVGYANDQLGRIKRHKRWLTDPPTHRPTRAEFELPELMPVTNAQLKAAEQLMRNHVHEFAPWLLDSKAGFKAEFWTSFANLLAKVLSLCGYGWDYEHMKWHEIESEINSLIGAGLGMEANFELLVQKEKAYSRALRDYKAYQTWKSERNESRAALEAAHGYDTKHGMHLVRLMRTGEEILNTGIYKVKRHDAQELLEIRNGAWSYDQILGYSEQKTAEIKNRIRAGEHHPTLRRKPNYKNIQRCYHNIIESRF